MSSSRQILNPPAEIVTPRARSRRMRKKPEVASRTGVKPRASTHANVDMSRRDMSQPSVPPPGMYRLPMTMSAPVWRRTASMRGTSDGGWLRSASMTPTNSAVAAVKPSITAVPRPSLPALCTTRMGKRCASSSATWPVPSGELSSTITSSPSTPPASYAAKIARTSSGSRSRSLYVGTTSDSVAAVAVVTMPDDKEWPRQHYNSTDFGPPISARAHTPAAQAGGHAAACAARWNASHAIAYATHPR